MAPDHRGAYIEGAARSRGSRSRCLLLPPLPPLLPLLLLLVVLLLLPPA